MYVFKPLNWICNLLQVYLNSKPNALNKVIAPSTLDKANPKCYVCSPQPEVRMSF